MIEEVLRYWRMGGALMPVLAILSYGIWFYFLKLRIGILGVVRVPLQFEDDLLQLLATCPHDEILAHYAHYPDTMSRAVCHVLKAIQFARKPGEAFDQFQEAHLESVRQDLLLLSALTAAAPLLGLLGTVIGMVATFQAVSGSFGNMSVHVSAGISQALITTQCGLAVAIPGLFGAARIRRLMDQMRVRLGECRLHLVFNLDASVSNVEAP